MRTYFKKAARLSSHSLYTTIHTPQQNALNHRCSMQNSAINHTQCQCLEITVISTQCRMFKATAKDLNCFFPLSFSSGSDKSIQWMSLFLFTALCSNVYHWHLNEVGVRQPRSLQYFIQNIFACHSELQMNKQVANKDFKGLPLPLSVN